MSWTDKKAVEHIKQIRDIFKVKTLVETGTFKGINAELHSKNFKEVFTCEKIKDYYYKAKERLSTYDNVFISYSDSSEFLKRFLKIPNVLFYLDAHFYDYTLPKNKRFVVLDELKMLKGKKDSIIVIHDFDNNLGHIVYDGQSLDLNLLRNDLLKINPNFKFYTNELSSCDPVTLIEQDIKDAGLNLDADTIDNLQYAWSCPRLTYRGILYCVSKKINIEGLREIK